jgi:DNA invertase Pin-like site-specific DNA recombinase
MASRKKTLAIAYLRTSSAANVGTDKDSDKRQRAAIEAFAKRAGYELVDEFYDAAVSGADPIDMRPASPPCLSGSRATVCGRSLSRRRAASLAI